jgi:hypothetical protein
LEEKKFHEKQSVGTFRFRSPKLSARVFIRGNSIAR